MSKIKFTKNELKTQRDALARFTRYLPTLQLKKQQLQLEIDKLEKKIIKFTRNEEEVRAQVQSWISLFAEDYLWESLLEVEEVRTARGNIAGVDIPILEDIEFLREMPDLFCSPPWIDDAVEVLEKWIQFLIERKILEIQVRTLAEELRTTTQRVNLFEKVKIPEAQENIRVIRIFLGDQQTAAVARSKLAKRKGVNAA